MRRHFRKNIQRTIQVRFVAYKIRLLIEFVSFISKPRDRDKLYTQIVKVFRFYLRIEPFAVMSWALVIVRVLTHILKQLTQPAGLASHNSGTGTVLYGRG